jgi:signal transduction histidine kinase
MQTILVVDDESGVRMSIEVVFKSMYRVLQASNSTEALRVLQKEQPQVAILDIKMVNESGLDLLPALKLVSPMLEVVMLTGYETIDAAKTALRRGACDFLSKPFDLGTLKQAVERAFKLRMASEAAERSRLMVDEFREENAKLTEDHFLIQTGVLHDVRNMQTVLNGYLDLIDCTLEDMRGRGATAAELSAIHAQIKTVYHSSDTSMQLLSRFLSFARQSMAAKPECDVTNLLGDIRSLVQTHPDARQCTFTVEHDRAGGSAMVANVPSADVIRMLLNLVLNAAQSTPKPQNIRIRISQVTGTHVPSEQPGGNTISVGAENIQTDASYITIAVQDQGPGIPEGRMQQTFENFVTTKSDNGGSGLGLGVVKRLVIENKGMIKIASRVGMGTTVTLVLPGYAATPGEHAPAGAP